MGIANSFAVPLPVLLDLFKETKERLGKLVNRPLVASRIRDC